MPTDYLALAKKLRGDMNGGYGLKTTGVLVDERRAAAFAIESLVAENKALTEKIESVRAIAEEEGIALGPINICDKDRVLAALNDTKETP